jgi:hypothetical protein
MKTNYERLKVSLLKLSETVAGTKKRDGDLSLKVMIARFLSAYQQGIRKLENTTKRKKSSKLRIHRSIIIEDNHGRDPASIAKYELDNTLEAQRVIKAVTDLKTVTKTGKYQVKSLTKKRCGGSMGRHIGCEKTD